MSLEQQQETKKIAFDLLKIAYEHLLGCSVHSIKPMQEGDFYRFEYSKRNGITSVHTVRKTQAMNMISRYVLAKHIDIMNLCLMREEENEKRQHSVWL